MSTYQLLKNVFRTIYSPVKAFKEVSQNPTYVGPVLIMILFTAANVGSLYVILSKEYVQQILPTPQQLDTWTENSTLWTSTQGSSISDNFVDFVNGSIYGNRSIEFSIVNSNQIEMELNNIGPINCSSPNGYTTLYLRVKQISPANNPEDAAIDLLSNVSDYFYYNSTDNFSNSTTNVWNNLTISLSLDSSEWLKSGTNADLGNITGLKFDFTWSESGNITLLVDGLFFGGIFQSQAAGVTSYLFNFAVISFMQFILMWIFIGGILYIMAKGFRASIVWRPLLILVGFALITMFVQALINAVAFATLPTLRYPFALIGGVNGEGDAVSKTILDQTYLVTQIGRYTQIGVYIWTIALCALAVRLLATFSWTKSLLVATVAYFASMIIASFILGL